MIPLPAADDYPGGTPERWLTARDILPFFGLKLTKNRKIPRSLDRLIHRKVVPAPEYQVLGRQRFRRVWAESAILEQQVTNTAGSIPEKRREDFATGRTLANEVKRERRDVAWLAKRVLVELGAEELHRTLAPLHSGPLKDIRRGHGSLIRITLQSALRRAGVEDPRR